MRKNKKVGNVSEKMYLKKIYVTSDTHFFHDDLLKPGRSRFGKFINSDEMTEKIIENWNSIVNKEDIVIHLGDVAFQAIENKEKLEKIINRLNGTKILLPGNYDEDIANNDRSFFYNVGFNNVEVGISKMVVGNVILSHCPVDEISDKYINIHGHLHVGGTAELYSYDRRRLNVNMEYTDFKPMLFAKVSDGENIEWEIDSAADIMVVKTKPKS